MADERIRIIAELVGVKEGIHTLDELKKAVSDLEKRKVDIPVDIANARKSMQEFNDTAKKYHGYSVKMAKDGYAGLSKIWEGRSQDLKVQANAQKDIIRNLNVEKALNKQALDYADQISKEWKASASLQEKAVAAVDRRWNEYYADREKQFQAAEKHERDLMVLRHNAVTSVEDAWKRYEAEQEQERQARIQRTADGFRMLTNGFANAFSFTADLSRTVGNTFSSMASLFNTNFVDVARIKLSSMFQNMIMGNIGAALSRADIMNTFIPYMTLAGVTEEDAQAALNRVDLSIRGLPIGLDEAAQRLRRYQMFIGDTQRATDLTIGIQKAITAGGAPESFKTQAYYMIDRLLTAGTLSTSRQWYSLINGLGVSVRFLSEAMGVGKITAAEFAAGLASKKYSVEQFLDAIVALGNGTASSAAELDKALNIYKSTFESWLSNIRFAVVRGTTNVINAMDAVLEEGTGKKIIGYMEDFRDGINSIFSGAAEWVKNNPEPIVRVVNAVTGLVDAFDKASVGNIAGGILNNFARVLEYIGSLMGRLSGGNFGEFISFATTIAGPIGMVMTKLAGTLPVLLGVFQRFKNFDFESFIDKILVNINVMASLIERILRIFDDEKVANLMAFALVWGKPLATVIRLVGSALLTMATGKLANAGTNLATAFGAIGKGFKDLGEFLATGVGGVISGLGALGAVLGFAASQAKKSHDANVELIRDVRGLNEFSELTDSINDLAESAKKTTDETDGLRASLAQQKTETRDLVDELLSLNDAAGSRSDRIERMTQIVSQLNGMYSEWGLTLNTATGRLDENSVAVLRNADAMMAAAQTNAIAANLEQLYTDRLSLQINHATQSNEIERLDQRVTYLRNWYNRRKQSYRDRADELGLKYSERDVEAWAGHAPVYTDPTTGKTVYLWEELDQAEGELGLAKQSQQALEEQQSTTEKQIEIAQRMLEENEQAAMSARNTADAVTEANGQIGSSVDELSEKYAELTENAKESLESQMEGFEKLDKIEATPLTGEGSILEGIQSRIANLKQYKENVETLLNYLDEHSDDPAITTFFQTLINGGYDFAGDIAGVANAIKNGGDISTTVSQYSEYLALLGDVEALQGTAIEQVNSTADSFLEKQQNLETMSAILQEHMEAWGPDTDKAMGEVVEALDEEPVKTQVDAIGEAIGSLATTIEQNKDNLVIPAVYSLMDGVIAATRVKGYEWLQTAISFSQQVAATLSTTHGLQGNTNLYTQAMNRMSGIYDARGGMVYAANGMFIPRGTDTVPAMLTPGEFVVNRRATQTIGASILAQINRLDIPGALHSLMHRIPSMTGSSIVNNTSTRDNHAKVTQNFYNSSDDGFAYRRANRFVRALV